ncbi:MAG: sulfite exporter TauE/SafE family protein [Desulfovibrio sp.]
MDTLLPLWITVFFAGFVQGLTGFGSVLISLPILAVFLPFKTLIPLISLFALCINIVLMFQLYRSIPTQKLIPLLIGTAPGIYAGVHLLTTFPEHILEICLGIIISGFAAYSLVGKEITLQNNSPLIPTGAGFLAGCLGGSIGANGPPIIIYSTVLKGDRHIMKSLMCGYFFFAGIGISSMHGYKGLLTEDVMQYFYQGLPALGGGILLGTVIYKMIGETTYRKSVMLLILCLGIFMLKQGFAH